MEVQSLGPLRVGSLLWQSPRGGWVLTVVGKATFDLLQGDARLSERQDDVVVRDRVYEDGQGGVHTSTDLVPFKPHVDVVVVGHAFAAREETPRVIVARVAVGEMDKSLELGPETRVDIDPAGPQRLTLPRNVGGDAPEVGFGPHPESARMRRERLGRHAATWSLADLADKPLPEDIDPAYFNAAPSNQRLQLLREDAVIALDHLHPTQPRLATKLPNVRARAFAETEQGVADVRMAADTLCVDADRGVATVTWRGQVLLENPAQAGTVLLTVEHASRPLTWADISRTRTPTQGHPPITPSTPPQEPPAAQADAARAARPPTDSSSQAQRARSDLDARRTVKGLAAPPPPVAVLPFVAAEGAPVSVRGQPPLGVTRPSAPVPVTQQSPPTPRPHTTPQTQDVMTLTAAAASGNAPPWLAMYAAKKAAAAQEAAAAAGAPASTPAPVTPRVATETPESSQSAVRLGTQPIDPSVLGTATAATAPAPAPSRPGGAYAPGTMPASAHASLQAPSDAFDELDVVEAEAVVRTQTAPPPPDAASSAGGPEARFSSKPPRPGMLELLAFDPRELLRIAPWRRGDVAAEADVMNAMNHAAESDAAGLARAVTAAASGPGYVAPVVRVDGELELVVDPLAWLRVVAATAAPFAPADGALREVAGACAAAGADTPPALLDSMATELEASLERATTAARAGEGGHTSTARRAAELDLIGAAKAMIASQRRWSRRVIRGERVVVGRLRLASGDALVCYVPEAFELQLPLGQRTPVATLAAIQERQDMSEAQGLCLTLVALARRSSLSPA